MNLFYQKNKTLTLCIYTLFLSLHPLTSFATEGNTTPTQPPSTESMNTLTTSPPSVEAKQAPPEQDILQPKPKLAPHLDTPHPQTSPKTDPPPPLLPPPSHPQNEITPITEKPKTDRETPGRTSSAHDLKVDQIEQGEVSFKSAPGTEPPPPLQTHLLDAKVIGQIKPEHPDHYPYFIFTGQTCENCHEDPSLYVFNPRSSRPTIFSYPGKVLDPENRALLTESRGFYGSCLDKKNDVLVFFQREKVDRKSKLQSSVLIVEAYDTYLSESLREKHLPSLSSVLKRVKSKNCFEIEGRNRLMTQKKIDVSRPRAAR